MEHLYKSYTKINIQSNIYIFKYMNMYVEITLNIIINEMSVATIVVALNANVD